MSALPCDWCSQVSSQVEIIFAAASERYLFAADDPDATASSHFIDFTIKPSPLYPVTDNHCWREGMPHLRSLHYCHPSYCPSFVQVDADADGAATTPLHAPIINLLLNHNFCHIQFIQFNLFLALIIIRTWRDGVDVGTQGQGLIEQDLGCLLWPAFV